MTNDVDQSFEAIFQLLEAGRRAESSVTNSIEAATKYYEAVYKMRELVLRLGPTPDEVSQARLLKSEALRYEEIASRLMHSNNDDNESDDNETKSNSTSFSTGDISSLSSSCADALQHWSLRPAPAPTKSPTALDRANSTLSEALDLDEGGKHAEACTLYTEAAESFLNALRQTNHEATRTLIKIRLERTLGRAEQLKH